LWFILLGSAGLTAQERTFSDIPFSRPTLPTGGTVDLALDLYLPEEVPERGDSLLEKPPYPVIVLCHGGSYVSGDKGEFRRLGIALARRGIAAVAINYRLGSVPDAGTETEAVSMVYADALEAFGWIAAHATEFALDTDRVYISGGSSGGHLTIATGILYPREAKQPVHLRGAIGLYGGYFTEHIDAHSTPLLILQGTADTACLPEASRFMAGLYHKAGAWCRLLMVEGMVHDWGGTRYQDKLVTRIDEFLRQSTAPGFPTGVGPEEGFLPTETLETVALPGGRFWQGNDVGEFVERPRHPVTVGPFRMARTEVTVAQFRRFVEATGYRTEVEVRQNALVLDLLKPASRIGYFEYRDDASWKMPYLRQNDGFAVTLVSWRDCVEFCNWLSLQDGLTPVYRLEADAVDRDPAANGWRLPTEAEWEYAAGQTWKGTPVRVEDLSGDYKYYYNPAALPASTLATEPDSLGFYFLQGNALEWCQDWYGPYTDAEQFDPQGSAESGARVEKGGGWYQSWYKNVLEPNNRWFDFPDDTVYNYVGFRVVRSSS